MMPINHLRLGNQKHHRRSPRPTLSAAALRRRCVRAKPERSAKIAVD